MCGTSFKDLSTLNHNLQPIFDISNTKALAAILHAKTILHVLARHYEVRVLKNVFKGIIGFFFSVLCNDMPHDRVDI